jgi:HlyD family secretion protein
MLTARKWRWLIPVIAVVVAASVFFYIRGRHKTIVLTGIVTTDPVVVSPQVAGQIDKLTVKEGDRVARDQLVAVLVPSELRADSAFYRYSAEGVAEQVDEGEAALRLQSRQTAQQIRQAEASLQATSAQRAEAAATLENARATLRRQKLLVQRSAGTRQDLDTAATAVAVAKARVDAAAKQVDAARAAVGLARANSEQIAVRRSALASTRQQKSAARAQARKASIRLGYSEIRSPVDGVVDVRAALGGEVVSPGQPIVTLIDPDNLWVRVDVEETYAGLMTEGKQLTVRLPWGEERTGTVYYRAVDAGFATQRDATREKRDIRTFEVRLHVDNADRKLASGLTVYVPLRIR